MKFSDYIKEKENSYTDKFVDTKQSVEVFVVKVKYPNDTSYDVFAVFKKESDAKETLKKLLKEKDIKDGAIVKKPLY